MRFANVSRHPPRKRGIQYAAALRFRHGRTGILGRPVKPGGDKCIGLCRAGNAAQRGPCDDRPLGIEAHDAKGFPDITYRFQGTPPAAILQKRRAAGEDFE